MEPRVGVATVLELRSVRGKDLYEPREGIGPSTSFLPRKRSATELPRHFGGQAKNMFY